MTPKGCKLMYPSKHIFRKKEGFFGIVIWLTLVFYVIKIM
jgi:hypothetical protein